MSETTETKPCHEYVANDLHEEPGEPERVWHIGPGKYLYYGYCPTCGVRLNADGTTIERVDVDVASSEAVRETALWRCLAEWTDEQRDEMGPLSGGRALLVLGLVDKHGVPTDAGRVILAALQQAGTDWQRVAEEAHHIIGDVVDGCDIGEARSQRTYSACKQWLEWYRQQAGTKEAADVD